MRWLVLAGALLAASCGAGAAFVESRYADGGGLRFRGALDRSLASPRARGEWTFWYQSGGVQARGSFQRGSLPSASDLDRERTRVPREGRSGPWIFWSESGQVLARGEYVNGLHHGWWSTWYTSGQRCCSGRFELGRPVGAHVSWHECGSVREESWYLDGVPHGRRRLWDEQGRLVWEGRYRAGFAETAGASAPPAGPTHGEGCAEALASAASGEAAVASASRRGVQRGGGSQRVR